MSIIQLKSQKFQTDTSRYHLHIFYSIIMVIISYSLTFGQTQYATTTDGKKVILKPNGTWEYVNSENKTSNSSARQNLASNSISRTNSSNSNSAAKKTSTRTYIRGPRGGCYYINSSGNKTYVDRSLCNLFGRIKHEIRKTV